MKNSLTQHTIFLKILFTDRKTGVSNWPKNPDQSLWDWLDKHEKEMPVTIARAATTMLTAAERNTHILIRKEYLFFFNFKDCGFMRIFGKTPDVHVNRINLN